MTNFIKLKTIILTLFMIFSSHSIAANTILPLPKPSVDIEIEKKTLKKKRIYPQKKPSVLNKEKKVVSQDEEKIELEDKSLTNIYPKKKPIIFVKKDTKTVSKSNVLSKRDFEVAKKVFDLIDQKKWKTALKTLQKTRDKDLYKLVNYIYLIRPSNAASFYDYSSFINNNPNYPRINRLRYLAEHKINIKTSTPRSIIKWFDNKEPLSSYGKIKLGESLILEGKQEQGSSLIKEGWTKAKLSKNELRYLRKKYKKIITVEDNVKRVDWHAWEGKHWDVKRMLRYLPKDYTTLYNARQILMSQSYGVDTAISKVDNKFKNDIGLKYDRLKWRRRRGRVESSLEILLNVPKDPTKLVRTDKWWKERAILSRSLIYKKKYALAYKVSSNHSMKEGADYAEAEWLSGWIALNFLEDPNLALQHFKNFFNNVGYPISLSRGAYWIARSYKTINNKDKSNEWYAEAAKYLNTYYGQLAFIEINPDTSISNTNVIHKPGEITFDSEVLLPLEGYAGNWIIADTLPFDFQVDSLTTGNTDINFAQIKFVTDNGWPLDVKFTLNLVGLDANGNDSLLSSIANQEIILESGSLDLNGKVTSATSKSTVLDCDSDCVDDLNLTKKVVISVEAETEGYNPPPGASPSIKIYDEDGELYKIKLSMALLVAGKVF